MTIPEAVLLIVPGGYQLFALTACIKRLFFREKPSTFTPGISILKPIRGADPAFYEAIQSHAEVDYPSSNLEILFGVREMTDPAVPHIQRLIAQRSSLSASPRRTFIPLSVSVISVCA